MSAEWACRLLAVAAASSGLVLAVTSADSGAAGAPSQALPYDSAAAIASTTCPQLRPRALRSPQRFLVGLAGAWVPLEAQHCLYVVRSGTSVPVPIFGVAPGKVLRGPVWSPTQAQVVVSYRRARGFEVALLDTAGQAVRRLLGRDATFFRDGRLLLRRADRLWLLSGNAKTLLVSRAELQRAAGFPITGYDLSDTDGYGREGAIVMTWGKLRSRLLLVRPDGTLSYASPIYRVEAGESMPGPPAWSPDGDVLLIPWQHNHPTNALSHEHCLARWTAAYGYRATLCRNPHFDRILWHRDGGIALLNNGLIVARDGTVRARFRYLGRAPSVRWKRPVLAKVG